MKIRLESGSGLSPLIAPVLMMSGIRGQHDLAKPTASAVYDASEPTTIGTKSLFVLLHMRPPICPTIIHGIPEVYIQLLATGSC